jgi:hypothetical protein
MGVKAWKVKLLINTPENRAALEYTLQQWNAYSARLCKALLDYRRGDFGHEGLAVWEQLKKTPQNYHVLYCITEPSRVHKDNEYHLAARAFVQRHDYHADLAAVRRESGPLWKQLIKSARERVLSHEEKVKNWDEQHKQWIEQKCEWEERNLAYMAVRPLIDAYHREHGATRGRRVAWRKWQDFLQSTQGLAAWRGGAPHVQLLTREELALAARNRRKATRRERELFFAKNPELAELDLVHGRYEREFARTAAKRRNPDGFRHRPTFTLPSLPTRPDWPRFQAEEGYKSLDLANPSVSLRLPTPDGPVWLPLSFVPDPRLGSLVPLKESVKDRRTRFDYQFPDRRGELVLAQPQELRLIQRNASYP